MKNYLWTLDGCRLQSQSMAFNSELNWLFLPGGPGLGSEALGSLTKLLKNKLPGVIWHLDLPDDGSNLLKDKPLSNWEAAIIQAVKAFDKVILVAHSTPGMFVQTMPELEGILQGLVLIGSAPNSSWQKTFADYCKNNVDPLILNAEKEYNENPNNETLRQLLIASAKYCFTTDTTLVAGKELFKKLPVNHLAAEWSSQNFDSEGYLAKWIPENVPTLITTGSKDAITPLNLFSSDERYQRDNILIKEIADAGHYPWFENPQGVISAFAAFCKLVADQKG
ncbi:MAG: alpha/beta hydrolase [Tatlockia sp.]|nr:alpha/beta hydrolase [Tatlockia sp.]